MSDAQALATCPAHVPAALVYDFDIHNDRGLLTDPHERILRLVEEAPPLFWTPRNGGHWMVLKYGDAVRVMRNPDIFSSAPIVAYIVAAWLSPQ
ncbi:cytochrome P450 [Sphingobium sufflavum]|uniref:cytochrome P450 n=1 Tax=Sphingobium sufflavum TaxID=1129547 RepID=UPI001F33DEBB|nr:cytochrome P450 [Sphingobium sufflavum]MCE7796530.1 cytochrome P450 [Sphingobium sufflavum]